MADGDSGTRRWGAFARGGPVPRGARPCGGHVRATAMGFCRCRPSLSVGGAAGVLSPVMRCGFIPPIGRALPCVVVPCAFLGISGAEGLTGHLVALWVGPCAILGARHAPLRHSPPIGRALPCGVVPCAFLGISGAEGLTGHLVALWVGPCAILGARHAPLRHSPPIGRALPCGVVPCAFLGISGAEGLTGHLVALWVPPLRGSTHHTRHAPRCRSCQ